MNFLVWWNPATWFSDVTGNIMGAIVQGIRSLFYMLSTAVYRLITKVYNLFEVLCHARLLDDSVVKALADRIGLILGIIMLFVVTFSFIQMLINPDAIEDKEKGAISVIKRVLLVIVMLGISNFAFATLHKLQVVVINSHVISKLLLPYEVDTENFGNVLSADLFTSFYRVDSSLKDYIGTEHDVDGTIELCYDETNVLRKQIYDNNNFHLGYSCLNASAKVQDEDGKSQEVTIMDFDYLLMLGCGVAVLYFLAMYCFSVGVRTIQLSVLEILSPMAIVSYLSPKKDNMFSKWIKMYFSTYIDVFIRIGIINFVIFLISTILDSEGGWTFWESVGNPTDDFTVILISIVMILALLTFAKKAPDMLKDLFPVGASKLGFGAQSPRNFFKDISSSPLATPFKMAAAPVGLLARKTLGGVDSAIAGQGFRKGWGKVHGKFGTWVNKQQEQYMPELVERRKQRLEGNKEVTDIRNKWDKGSDIAHKLMRAGATKYDAGGVDAATGLSTDWNKVLNGDQGNKKYYSAIFKNENFVTSKMHVDAESSVEDELRRGYNQIQAGGSFTWNGTTYSASAGNIDAFSKLYEDQQKKVSGLKEVHESMRKQYQADAKVEDQYKFIKNNLANPANPGTTRQNRSIQ